MGANSYICRSYMGKTGRAPIQDRVKKQNFAPDISQ